MQLQSLIVNFSSFFAQHEIKQGHMTGYKATNEISTNGHSGKNAIQHILLKTKHIL